MWIFHINGLDMGIKGAALATLISRACGAVLSLSFLAFKYKLINFKYNSVSELLKSWHDIIAIGIPGAIVRLLPQLVRAVITKLSAIVVV